MEEEKYYYIKHNNGPTVYKVSQAFIESSNLLGTEFLENFVNIESYTLKRYTAKENDCGHSPGQPYIINEKHIYHEESKTNILTMTCEHLDLIMGWYNAWGRGYKNSFYYIDNPIRQKNYRLTFKPVDTKWFNEFYNYIYHRFPDNIKAEIDADVNKLICHYIKYIHDLLLCVEFYLKMPFFADKLYGFIIYILSSATHEDITKIKSNPLELQKAELAGRQRKALEDEKIEL